MSDAAARRSGRAGRVVLAGVVLMMCRIRFEERLLVQDETYRNYMAAVRYRLIPGLY